ncbi:MAG TPA: class I SAM-dependent methyltransferase, partial [Gemmatimonadaceae bacterium]|nr:class I SAM-dependent methyltransferase [Gemmatimonadaceae bacterium]
WQTHPPTFDPVKNLRTEAENEVGRNIERIFSGCSDSVEAKLENFPKYVRRNHLKRFLAMYELFKLAMPVKGSVVECGVYRGFGIMTWAKLSTILEPENLTRRIYGFDTFDGFPTVGDHDRSEYANPAIGDLRSSSYDELLQLIAEYDRDRFLGHLGKVELVRGDITVSAPAFVESHPHVVVSLLFIDCDLYAPTKAALDAFLPRMPKGAIVAFDELDNPLWPGETLATLDGGLLKSLRLQRLEWDPYISYAVIE